MPSLRGRISKQATRNIAAQDDEDAQAGHALFGSQDAVPTSQKSAAASSSPEIAPLPGANLRAVDGRQQKLRPGQLPDDDYTSRAGDDQEVPLAQPTKRWKIDKKEKPKSAADDEVDDLLADEEELGAFFAEDIDEHALLGQELDPDVFGEDVDEPKPKAKAPKRKAAAKPKVKAVNSSTQGSRGAARGKAKAKAKTRAKKKKSFVVDSDENSCSEESEDDDGGSDYSESLDDSDENSVDRAERKKKRAKNKQEKEWQRKRRILVEKKKKEQDELDRLRTYTKAYKGVLLFYDWDDEEIADEQWRGAAGRKNLLQGVQELVREFPTAKYPDPDDRPEMSDEEEGSEDYIQDSSSTPDSSNDEDAASDDPMEPASGSKSSKLSRKQKQAAEKKRTSALAKASKQKSKASILGEKKSDDATGIGLRPAEDSEMWAKPKEATADEAFVFTWDRGVMTEKMAKDLKGVLVMCGLPATNIAFLSQMERGKRAGKWVYKAKADYKPIKNLKLPEKVFDWHIAKTYDPLPKLGANLSGYRRFDVETPKLASLPETSFLDDDRTYPVFDEKGMISVPMLLSAHKALFGAFEKYFKDKWRTLLKRPGPDGGIQLAGQGNAKDLAGSGIPERKDDADEEDLFSDEEFGGRGGPAKNAMNLPGRGEEDAHQLELRKNDPAFDGVDAFMKKLNLGSSSSSSNAPGDEDDLSASYPPFEHKEHLQKAAALVSVALSVNLVSAQNISLGAMTESELKEAREWARKGLTLHDGRRSKEMKGTQKADDRIADLHAQNLNVKLKEALVRDAIRQQLEESGSFGKRKRVDLAGAAGGTTSFSSFDSTCSQVMSGAMTGTQQEPLTAGDSFDRLLGPATRTTTSAAESASATQGRAASGGGLQQLPTVGANSTSGPAAHFSQPAPPISTSGATTNFSKMAPPVGAPPGKQLSRLEMLKLRNKQKQEQQMQKKGLGGSATQADPTPSAADLPSSASGPQPMEVDAPLGGTTTFGGASSSSRPPPKNLVSQADASNSQQMNDPSTTSTLTAAERLRLQEKQLRQAIYRPQLSFDNALDVKFAEADELIILDDSQNSRGTTMTAQALLEGSNKNDIAAGVKRQKALQSKVEFLNQDIRYLLRETYDTAEWRDSLSVIRNAISALPLNFQDNLVELLQRHIAYKKKHPAPDFETFLEKEKVVRGAGGGEAGGPGGSRGNGNYNGNKKDGMIGAKAQSKKFRKVERMEKMTDTGTGLGLGEPLVSDKKKKRTSSKKDNKTSREKMIMDEKKGKKDAPGPSDEENMNTNKSRQRTLSGELKLVDISSTSAHHGNLPSLTSSSSSLHSFSDLLGDSNNIHLIRGREKRSSSKKKHSDNKSDAGDSTFGTSALGGLLGGIARTPASELCSFDQDKGGCGGGGGGQEQEQSPPTAVQPQIAVGAVVINASNSQAEEIMERIRREQMLNKDEQREQLKTPPLPQSAEMDLGDVEMSIRKAAALEEDESVLLSGGGVGVGSGEKEKDEEEMPPVENISGGEAASFPNDEPESSLLERASAMGDDERAEAGAVIGNNNFGNRKASDPPGLLSLCRQNKNRTVSDDQVKKSPDVNPAWNSGFGGQLLAGLGEDPDLRQRSSSFAGDNSSLAADNASAVAKDEEAAAAATKFLQDLPDEILSSGSADEDGGPNQAAGGKEPRLKQRRKVEEEAELRKETERAERKIAKLLLKKRRLAKLAAFKEVEAEESDASESEDDGDLRLESDGDDDDPDAAKKKNKKKKPKAKKTPAGAGKDAKNKGKAPAEEDADNSDLDDELDSLIGGDSSSEEDDPDERRRLMQFNIAQDTFEEDSWLARFVSKKKQEKQRRKEEQQKQILIETENDELKKKAREEKKMRRLMAKEMEEKDIDSEEVDVGEEEKAKVRNRYRKAVEADQKLLAAKVKAAMEKEAKAKERLEKFLNQKYEGDLMTQLCRDQEISAGLIHPETGEALPSRSLTGVGAGGTKQSAKEVAAEKRAVELLKRQKQQKQLQRMKQKQRAAAMDVSSEDSEEEGKQWQAHSNRQLGLAGAGKRRGAGGVN